MPYFLLIILGFIASLFIAWRICKEKLYSERVVFDTVILTSLFALIGSRLVYVLFHPSDFGFNVLRWVVVGLYPGLSIGGALLGAAVVLWLVSDKKRVVPFPELADVLTRTFLIIILPVSIVLLFISPEIGNLFGVGLAWLRLICLLITISIVGILNRMRPLSAGTYSAVAWTLLIVSYFLIEFVKPSNVYYWKLNVDQWIYSLLLLVILIIIAFQLKRQAFFKAKK